MSVVGEEIQFFITSAHPFTLMFLPQPEQALPLELVQPTCSRRRLWCLGGEGRPCYNPDFKLLVG
jgi:hypothetical protein